METPKTSTFTECAAEGCYARTKLGYCKHHREELGAEGGSYQYPQRPRTTCPTCGKSTWNGYCREHSSKYVPCEYPGCVRRSRNGFCHRHNPETMERKNAYTAKWKAEKRAQKKQNASQPQDTSA